MASTAELLSAGIFLIVNTVVIAVSVLIGGPVFGSLMSFVSNYQYAAGSPLQPSIVQWIPSFFFTFLVILEISLIVRLAYIVVSKTDYQGETEW